MFTVLPSHLVFSSLHKTMMIESPSHTEGLEFRHGRTKHKCEAKGLVTSGSERLINNLINQNQNEPENVPTSPGRQALYIRGVRDFFPSPPPPPLPHLPSCSEMQQRRVRAPTTKIQAHTQAKSPRRSYFESGIVPLPAWRWLACH